MKVANIFPINNQALYKHESFVMILAHLVTKGLYDTNNFNRKGQYVIMDNGLYENSKISDDLEDIIMIAETCGIKVDEIVIPDAMFDKDKTISLFLKNLESIRMWQHKYRFMFVAQAKTPEEFEQVIEFINKNRFVDLNLSIGIPKKCIVPRDSDFAKRQYIRCVHPIHLLGIKNTFKELVGIRKYIRSCDSSQITFIAKNENDLEDLDIINYVRKGIDIDLEHDKVDKKKLNILLAKEKEAFKVYGIL